MLPVAFRLSSAPRADRIVRSLPRISGTMACRARASDCASPKPRNIVQEKGSRSPEGEAVCAEIRSAAYNLRDPEVLLPFLGLDPTTFSYRRFDPAASPAPCICPDIARTGSKPRKGGRSAGQRQAEPAALVKIARGLPRGFSQDPSPSTCYCLARGCALIGTSATSNPDDHTDCFADQMRLDYLWSLSPLHPNSKLAMFYAAVLQQLTIASGRLEFR